MNIIYKEYTEKAIEVLKNFYGDNNHAFNLAYRNDLNTVINSIVMMEQVQLLKEIRDKEVTLDFKEIIEELKSENKKLIEQININNKPVTTKKSTSKK